MSKNINFEIGTVVTDTFLDSVQELLTGTFQNLSLGVGPSNQTLTLNLSGDSVYDKLGTVNIGGKYCYIDQQKVSGTTTGTGLRSIWVSTSENGAIKEPAFNLTIGASAPVESYVRKIGEVTATSGVLSNAKLINGVQIDGDQYNSFTFRTILDTAEETILALDGQSTQVSTAGTYDSSVSPSPAKALSVGVSGSEKLYIDTAGRIVFNGTAAIQQTLHGASTVLTTNKEFSSHITGADQPSFSARSIDTDTQNRITIMNTGSIHWGSGAAASDTYIYRSAANILTLGLGDKLQQNEAPTVGDDLTNKTYVDTATNLSFDDLNNVSVAGAAEGELVRFDTPLNQWVNTPAVTIDDSGRLHVKTDSLSAGISFGEDSGAEATITWAQDNTLEITGRTVHTGALNVSSSFLENGVAPVVNDTYDIQSPNDNVLLCKTSTGDLYIRLTNKTNATTIGGNPVADGDLITVKDSDGGALTNNLALVAEGVRKRNVPTLQATSLTGTITDLTTTTTPGGTNIDEVQEFKVSGSGTFKITFDGQESPSTLTETSTGQDVVDAINLLSPHANYGYFSVSTPTPAASVTAGVSVSFDGGTLIDGEATYYINTWGVAKAIYKDAGTFGEWYII